MQSARASETFEMRDSFEKIVAQADSLDMVSRVKLLIEHIKTAPTCNMSESLIQLLSTYKGEEVRSSIASLLTPQRGVCIMCAAIVALLRLRDRSHSDSVSPWLESDDLDLVMCAVHYCMYFRGLERQVSEAFARLLVRLHHIDTTTSSSYFTDEERRIAVKRLTKQLGTRRKAQSVCFWPRLH